MTPQELAFSDHAKLQLYLKFKSLANVVMVPGHYAEVHAEFKQFVTNEYNETVKRIEDNEWYKAEKAAMIEMAKDMASDNKDIDPNFEPKMSEILKRA